MELHSQKYKPYSGVVWLYEALLGVGVGLVAGTVFYVLLDVIQARSKRIRPIFEQGFKFGNANIWAIIVMVAVFIWLRNIIPALIAAIITVYLPYQITYTRQKRFRNLALEQLSSAVTLFANTFMITKNIPRAIETVGKRIPDPVGGVFRSAYAELVYGTPLDDVADRLAKKIGLSYGYIFASLLKSANKQGEVVAPLIRELSNKIASARDQQNFQIAEVSSVRMMNMFLLALPIPTYIVLSTKLPETAKFMASTAGTVLFTLWLLAIVIWLFMDRLVIDN